MRFFIVKKPMILDTDSPARGVDKFINKNIAAAFDCTSKMVVFSCDGCGEVLKKNQVECHANRCRRCFSVSCADCLVSFYGDDYRKHTSCITEAERYEKSVYRGEKDKKKKNPQEAWMALIASASTTAPVSIRDSLKMLASLDNVPRKPKQFRNFTANSLNLRGNNDIVDSMWKHLSQLRDEEHEAKKKKEEEQKLQKEEEEAKEKSLDAQEKLSVRAIGKELNEKKITDAKDKVTSKKVKKAMKKVLKKAPRRTLKLKELCRAVRNHLECGDSDKEELKEMIGEQIKVDNIRIKVDGKLVTLR